MNCVPLQCRTYDCHHVDHHWQRVLEYLQDRIFTTLMYFGSRKHSSILSRRIFTDIPLRQFYLYDEQSTLGNYKTNRWSTEYFEWACKFEVGRKKNLTRSNKTEVSKWYSESKTYWRTWSYLCKAESVFINSLLRVTKVTCATAIFSNELYKNQLAISEFILHLMADCY